MCHFQGVRYRLLLIYFTENEINIYVAPATMQNRSWSWERWLILRNVSSRQTSLIFSTPAAPGSGFTPFPMMVLGSWTYLWVKLELSQWWRITRMLACGGRSAWRWRWWLGHMSRRSCKGLRINLPIPLLRNLKRTRREWRWSPLLPILYHHARYPIPHGSRLRG